VEGSWGLIQNRELQVIYNLFEDATGLFGMLRSFHAVALD